MASPLALSDDQWSALRLLGLRRSCGSFPWQSCSKSPSAQTRDDSARPGELPFVIGRTRRIPGIAHRFKRHIDLAERGLSHGGVPPPLGEID